MEINILIPFDDVSGSYNYQCNLYFSFIPNEWNKVGLYVAANPLTSDDYYFEAEIVDTGLIAAIGETFHCANISFYISKRENCKK